MLDRNAWRMGIGIVARNHEGNAVAALCSSRPDIFDPAMAEAMDAWRMAKLSYSLGFWQIIVEGDALEVVQALRREGSNEGRYRHLVDDAKLLLN